MVSSIIILAYKNNQNDLLLVYTQHLHCSYSGKSLAEVYQQHEKEKKDKYNQRVIDIEKSSFNPLVFTTTGGMAPESECNRVNKRLAEKIADKRRKPYASVITYIRTKLRFALLRSTLAAI